MRRHLNTLYVTTQGAYLAKEGEAVLVRLEGRPKLRIPVHNLEGIVCFGNVSCSPFLMGHCGQNGVRISFLSRNGRFLANVQGRTTGNVLLRREQYRRAEAPDASAAIARSIVLAKASNSRLVLLRARRDHPETAGAGGSDSAIAALSKLRRRIEPGTALDRLRGIEGAAARLYFAAFSNLIVQQRSEFEFKTRTRRPPTDPMNALLSFIYTVLVHDASAALEAVGLDPAVGYLHRFRPGRPSLALDVVEELRAFIADRLAVSLVNLRILTAADFHKQPTGAVYLREEGRKRVLAAYQKRKEDTLTHPYLQEKTTIGMLPHIQALLMSRYLRGDLDGYPSFFAR